MERTNRLQLSPTARRLVFNEAPELAEANGHKVVTYPHIAAAFFHRDPYTEALLNSGLSKQDVLDWGHGLKISPAKPGTPLTIASTVFDRTLRMLFEDAEGLAHQELVSQIEERHLFRVLFDPKKDGAFHDIFLFKDAEKLHKAIFEELGNQTRDERAA